MPTTSSASRAAAYGPPARDPDEPIPNPGAPPVPEPPPPPGEPVPPGPGEPGHPRPGEPIPARGAFRCPPYP